MGLERNEGAGRSYDRAIREAAGHTRRQAACVGQIGWKLTVDGETHHGCKLKVERTVRLDVKLVSLSVSG